MSEPQVPKTLRPEVDAIWALTDACCAQRLDSECAEPEKLSALTGVPKSTMANKSRRIRDLLGLGPFDHEFCRRELLEQSPLAWLVVVDGIVVDARWLPPELQAEARRCGLIPDLEPTTTAA